MRLKHPTREADVLVQQAQQDVPGADDRMLSAWPLQVGVYYGVAKTVSKQSEFSTSGRGTGEVAAFSCAR